MNKKAITILGVIFLLIIGTLGFLVYSKYFNQSSSPSPAPTLNPVPTAAIPVATTSGQSALVKLSGEPVVSPTLFFNGQGVTYFTPSGDLEQADLAISGSALSLSNKRSLDIKNPGNFTKIIWPPGGDNFTVESDGATSTSWTYFNSTAGDYTPLPSQIESFDYFPGGTKIMYVWLQNNKATLNVSDPDSKNWKYLADMWETDDSIHISPDGTTVLYYETQNASSTNPIYSVTADGKVWKTLVSDGDNVGVLWSPDSQKFLFGKKDPSGLAYQLWVYDIMTGTEKNVGFETTPDKAVWSQDSTAIYVAVPNTITSPGSLTQDGIYKVTIATLAQQQYKNITQVIDAQNLFLTQDGNNVLFKNAQDGFLYYLNLEQ